jgi:hypothetical protein
VGGLASVFIGLEWGFNVAVIVALVLYGCAFAVFKRMRDTVTQGAKEPLPTPFDAPWQPGATARSNRSRA